MVEYWDFIADKRLQDAAEAYKVRFGGRFGGEEPGVRLVYETDDGEMACVPPDGATADQVLQDLQSGEPLPKLWPELVYDPNCVY